MTSRWLLLMQHCAPHAHQHPLFHCSNLLTSHLFCRLQLLPRGAQVNSRSGGGGWGRVSGSGKNLAIKAAGGLQASDSSGDDSIELMVGDDTHGARGGMRSARRHASGGSAMRNAADSRMHAACCHMPIPCSGPLI